MDELWRFRVRLGLLLCFLYQNLSCGWSLNGEGLALLKFREMIVEDPFGALLNWKDSDGEKDHCSWLGIECSDGKVVILNLKDLCLEGSLTSELGKLMHIKSIVLRNNSFSGVIPEEIAKLKELEMLDLGYNNFSGPLPSNLGNNLSLSILLFDNNEFLRSVSSELHELNMLSHLQVDENLLSKAAQGASCNTRSIPRNNDQGGNVAQRKLLQGARNSNSPGARNPGVRPARPFFLSPSPPIFLPPSPAPTPSPSSSPAPTPDVLSPALASPPIVITAPPSTYLAPVPSLSASPPLSKRQSSTSHSKFKTHHWLIVSGVLGASCLLISLVGLLLCRSKKVATVKPWATGLSGQLQKAFVTGVPKLKRSELEVACEDFSNIIGTSSDGTVYKGTLSSGVEIAVTSTAVKSTKDWSKQLESLFRKKIDTLSKANHKNFANLLGFCEEEEPFSRMMVFEYAPNGTLFEHLHIKESEHLEWGARLRIAMGMAYCLEHMHQLSPPLIHKNLHSTTVYLTEDYAAKISDHGFWDEPAAVKMGSTSMEFLAASSPDVESNVYSFGIILLETITGRFPYSVDNGPLVDWASEFLREEQNVRNMVDPTLKSYRVEDVEKLCEVIKSCIHADPKQRPTMKEVSARLRDITAMAPDGAIPKLSPLWWAELEIISIEAN